ncbi:MAG: hypothetical protein HYW23_02030 [Candidatus Aenigmarchaeota archaeon]|nr:hypothetical protein [Candidatus Aenigmarchaeota archaeon]
MKNVREVRDKINFAWHDAKHFYSEDYPPSFVGFAKSRYVKTTGETEISWNCDRFKARIFRGGAANRTFESGDIEIEGNLLVRALFGAEDEATYVFSRSGLLKAVVRAYSHTVRHEKVMEGDSKPFSTSEKEYWPHILKYYLEHGDFDIGDRKFGEFRKLANGIGQFSDRIEKAHFEEMLDSARLLKEVYDKSNGYKSLVPLKSIKPFSKATPKRIEVNGEGMNVLYIPSFGGSGIKEKLSGSVYLFSNEPQAIPVPAVIRAGLDPKDYAEFPITNADMIRTDGQPKRGEIKLEAKELELYAGKVGEADFGKYGKEIWDYIRQNPLTYISLAFTVGLPVWARFLRVRPLIIGLPIAGVGLGSFVLYRAFANARTKVSGDDYIYFKALGKERT